MKKRKKVPILYMALAFLIPTLLILAALAGLKVTPFGDNSLVISDGNGLYINYLGYVARVFKGQEDVLFSFEKGLGGNMMGSWGWFLLNPTFALFALFDITQYPMAFTLVSLLNFCLSGLTMYILLKDCYGHRISNLIFSTAYALNGFLVANVFQVNFFACIPVLPIMVLGLRRIFNDKSPLIYILSLAYSLLMNFYFGFMLCVASFLMSAICFVTNRNALENRKSIAIKYILSSLLAGTLSAFVWLPALLSLRGGRLDQSIVHAISFKENMPFLDMASKLFIGANSTAELQDGLPNIFVGLLPVALVILFFISKQNSRRKKTVAAFLLGFYLLSFYVSVLNILMHGGTVTNWFNYRDSFVFAFLLLLVAAEEWQHITEEPKQNLKHTAIILVIATLLVFSKQFPHVTGGEMLLDFAILAVMVLAYRMHKRNPEKNPRRVLSMVVLLLVCLELFLNYSFSTKKIMGWTHSVDEYQEIVTPVSALTDAVSMSDPDFFRMEISEQRSGNQGNDPMLYGYNGVGHGGSDDRDFIRTTLGMFGVRHYNMRSSYYEGVPAATDALLGLKYIISKDDLTEEKHYDRLVDLGKWILYKNPNALPIALLSNPEIVEIEPELTDVFENLNRTYSAMTGMDVHVFIEEDAITFSAHNTIDTQTMTQEEAVQLVTSRDSALAGQDARVQTVSESENDSSPEFEEFRVRGSLKEAPENTSYIQFSWTAKQDGTVYIYNRSGVMDEWGSPLPALDCMGYYHEGETVTGYLPMEGSLVTQYLLEEVAGRFRAAYADDDALAALSATLRTRPTYIEKPTDSHLRGTFTAEVGQKLLFTIPYDEGWTLTVDGQKTQLEKTLDLFMAADVAPGSHTFEMRFMPTGLKIGLVISTLALIVLIIFLLFDSKKGSRHLTDMENPIIADPIEAQEQSELISPIPTKTELENPSRRQQIFQRYAKNDWLAAALVSLLVLVICGCQLTVGMPSDAWGDDFAAYISEGISIADGNFEEQTEVNYFYHPTQLSKEANDGRLVYVWGYPLIQSVIYKLKGFDFDKIIWYKIPLLLGLSLTGGILVMFFRRRFTLFTSTFMSILFCMSSSLHESLNKVGSDLPFLFLSLFTLLLMEVFTEHVEKGKGITGIGIACGVIMWMTYETRLSGSTVCITALIGYTVAVFQKRIRGRRVTCVCLPFAVMLILIFGSEHLWLAPATSNLSDLAQGPNMNTFKYPFLYLFAFYSTLLGISSPALGYAFVIISLIGMFVKGFKENLHLTILLLGSIIVICMLPYSQGLRYFYNVLPFIIMYLAYGFQFLAKHAGQLYTAATESNNAGNTNTKMKMGQLIKSTTLIGVMIVCCISPIGNAAYNLKHLGEKGAMDVYSPEAVEMYQYIKNKIPKDKVIAFPKPRALYLNTGRLSFRPGVNGHELEDADYYLLTTFRFGDFVPLDLSEVKKTVIFENEGYTLYRLD